MPLTRSMPSSLHEPEAANHYHTCSAADPAPTGPEHQVADGETNEDGTLSQLETEERQGRTMMWPPTLAAYGPRFRAFEDDDMFKWRILSHEFGLRWQSTPLEDRPALVETEPALVSPGWDALVAAWVDHHCYHDGIDPPDWVFKPSRIYRDGFWTPIPAEFEGLIAAAMVHSPAAFLARGVWVEERDLKVV